MVANWGPPVATAAQLSRNLFCVWSLCVVKKADFTRRDRHSQDMLIRPRPETEINVDPKESSSGIDLSRIVQPSFDTINKRGLQIGFATLCANPTLSYRSHVADDKKNPA